MLAGGKRSGGRWDFRKRQNSDALDRESRRVLGLIADYAPDLLYQVRDDSMSLNAAYTQAEKVRDAERHRLERAQSAVITPFVSLRRLHPPLRR